MAAHEWLCFTLTVTFAYLLYRSGNIKAKECVMYCQAQVGIRHVEYVLYPGTVQRCPSGAALAPFGQSWPGCRFTPDSVHGELRNCAEG